jgi:hypothetical protein
MLGELLQQLRQIRLGDIGGKAQILDHFLLGFVRLAGEVENGCQGVFGGVAQHCFSSKDR